MERGDVGAVEILHVVSFERDALEWGMDGACWKGDEGDQGVDVGLRGGRSVWVACGAEGEPSGKGRKQGAHEDGNGGGLIEQSVMR